MQNKIQLAIDYLVELGYTNIKLKFNRKYYFTALNPEKTSTICIDLARVLEEIKKNF